VLPGKTIAGLPEGAEPVDSYVLIKVRYDDGNFGWSFRMDDDYNAEELLGALISQADWLRHHMVEAWDR
jgi:hypothetical protein